MNRHLRRAQASQNKVLPTAQELAKTIETLSSMADGFRQAKQEIEIKLGPLVQDAKLLSGRLEEVQASLIKAAEENEALRKELAFQREIFLRMVSNVSQMSLPDVLLMEQQVQTHLTRGSSATFEADADKIAGNKDCSDKVHSSA
jgi:predicted nuclease with TOPRIM domain